MTTKTAAGNVTENTSVSTVNGGENGGKTGRVVNKRDKLLAVSETTRLENTAIPAMGTTVSVPSTCVLDGPEKREIVTVEV